MLNDDEVLVRGKIRRNIEFLLVGSIVIHGDGFIREVVRAEDEHLQSARVSFCCSGDVEFVALCNDRAGRDCGEERLLQVNRDGCILGVGKFDCDVLIIDRSNTKGCIPCCSQRTGRHDRVRGFTVGESAGCIDSVCASVNTNSGGVPLVFPRVVGLDSYGVTARCGICFAHAWECFENNTVLFEVLSGYEQEDGVTVSVGTGEFDFVTDVVGTVTGCGDGYCSLLDFDLYFVIVGRIPCFFSFIKS